MKNDKKNVGKYTKNLISNQLVFNDKTNHQKLLTIIITQKNIIKINIFSLRILFFKPSVCNTIPSSIVKSVFF